mmetsp:Transcript_45222/g.121885  ORF Transcript_45222/g.121885 Transcript_45222/m.121885 type:complete len:325 (+) Transcript_45222:694-1668(+)
MLDPLVAKRLLGRVPLLRVFADELADERLGVVGDSAPVFAETDVADLHLGKKLPVVGALERGVAAQQDVHDDSGAPQVAGLVVLPGQHLGRHVVRRAGLGPQPLALLELAGEAEVDQLQHVLLDRVLREEYEILWLQVSVADAVPMHVEDGAEHLLHDDRRLRLGEAACVDDAVEELAAFAELHGKVDVAPVLECLVQLDDVRMVHDLHDRDLLLEARHVAHLVLGDGLDRPRAARALVLAHADRAVRSLSELLIQRVRVLDPPRLVEDELAPGDAAGAGRPRAQQRRVPWRPGAGRRPAGARRRPRRRGGRRGLLRAAVRRRR